MSNKTPSIIVKSLLQQVLTLIYCIKITYLNTNIYTSRYSRNTANVGAKQQSIITHVYSGFLLMYILILFIQ